MMGSVMFRPGLLFSCPHLRIALRFAWICRHSDSSQHYIHHTHWQTNEYQYSSISRRDLYDDFRAKNINLRIKVKMLDFSALFVNFRELF
jgi:hypothetical protein